MGRLGDDDYCHYCDGVDGCVHLRDGDDAAYPDGIHPYKRFHRVYMSQR